MGGEMPSKLAFTGMADVHLRGIPGGGVCPYGWVNRKPHGMGSVAQPTLCKAPTEVAI